MVVLYCRDGLVVDARSDFCGLFSLFCLFSCYSRAVWLGFVPGDDGWDL